MTAFIAMPFFFMCCVHLAVLGAVGGGLASSAHEWLLQRLGAVIAQRGIAAVALGRCVLRRWHLEPPPKDQSGMLISGKGVPC
jgi:hypothetical protein